MLSGVLEEDGLMLAIEGKALGRKKPPPHADGPPDAPPAVK